MGRRTIAALVCLAVLSAAGCSGDDGDAGPEAADAGPEAADEADGLASEAGTPLRATPRWEEPLGEGQAALRSDLGVVVIDGDDAVSARLLDADTGNEVWSVTLPCGDPYESQSASVQGERLLLLFTQCLVSLDGTTGDDIDSVEPPRGGFSDDLLVGGAGLFVEVREDDDDALFEIDPGSLELTELAPTTDTSVVVDPAIDHIGLVSDERVGFLDVETGAVTEVDVRDGSRASFVDEGSLVVAVPSDAQDACSDARIVLVTGGDAPGTTELGGLPLCAMTALPDGSVAAVMAAGEELAAVRIGADGGQVWETALPAGQDVSSISFVDGYLYAVVVEDGELSSVILDVEDGEVVATDALARIGADSPLPCGSVIVAPGPLAIDGCDQVAVVDMATR